MKKHRYIFVPLEIGVLGAIMFFFLYGGVTNAIIGFVVWSLFRLAMLAYNDYKVRKLAPDNFEEALNVKPERKVVIFTNYKKAFEMCLESVDVLRRGKIKRNDKEQGIIVAKTGMNWNTFGSRITYTIERLTDLTTEIEIKGEPVIRSTKVDYGESWKAVEDISNFLDEKNQEMNIKHLSEKQNIPADLYANFSSKNKISTK